MQQYHIPHAQDAGGSLHRTAALLVALLLAAACLVAGEPVAGGSQRAYADEPIEISSAQQLADLAAAINGGNRAARTGSYILTADIDLSGYANWTPIGLPKSYNDSGGTTSFQGTFDGNGYTISNLTTDFNTMAFESGKRHVSGLFGCINLSACIKNVNLENVTITGTYAGADSDLMVGSLVGLAVNSSIVGCSVSDVTITDSFAGAGSATANYAFGGIVGDVYADGSSSCTVSNCSVADCTITAGAQYGAFNENGPNQAFAGGIAGRIRTRAASASGAIDHCSFSGTIRTDGFVSPMAGGARNQNNQKTAASITELAANLQEDCYYAASFFAADGTSAPNDSFNLEGVVWEKDADKKLVSYLQATKVDDANAAACQAALNRDMAGAPWWRVAYVGGSPSLVLDFRSAAVSQSPDNVGGGCATYSAQYCGFLPGEGVSGFSFAWSTSIPGGKTGTDSTFAAPIADTDSTVTLEATLEGGGSTAFRTTTTTTATVAAASGISLAITRETSGDAVTALKSYPIFANDCGFDEDDFNYQWYTIEDDGDVAISGATEKTLDVRSYDSGTAFRLVMTSKHCDTLHYSARSTNAGCVVYVQWDGGDDTRDGKTPTTSVQTLKQAYVLVGQAIAAGKTASTPESNIIVVMDAYDPDSSNFGTGNEFTSPATLTSFDPNNGEDYRATSEARLFWFGNNGKASSEMNSKRLEADTSFEDITLSGRGPNDASSANVGYIYCQGHSLTMGRGVAMTGYKLSSVNKSLYGLLDSSTTYDFNIIGGWANFGFADDYSDIDATHDKPCTITIRSGSYARIMAGCRSYGTTTAHHNQFGTEGHYFNVALVVDMESSQRGERVSGNYTGGTGTLNCDIAQLCGGQTDGTMYATSSVTLENGVVPLLLGSSIGYARSIVGGDGTVYPSNDFVGTAKVTVNGGQVAQLYGGCLGRVRSERIVADSRFRSFSDGRTGDDPDIDITLAGGSVGPIAGVVGSSTLTGVFAAGAGGITGQAAVAGGVGNEVDVSLRITGGSVTCNKNRNGEYIGGVYGGGYGNSSGVTEAAFACLEAGNLYGTSTVSISNAMLSCDVYGGGAGTSAYLAENPATNKLAQIVGDVSLTLMDSTVEGSVYGGGEGIVYAGVDCTDMAKIDGNVTLAVTNTDVGGSVFGGSALGCITGSVESVLDGAGAGGVGGTIGGSVFGGGEGTLLSGSNLTLEQQAKVGRVGGNVSLAVDGYAVTGDVYGGGSYGATGGSATTTLSNAQVAGSVYGAGKGSLLADYGVANAAALQETIGQVGGDAELAVTGSSIAGNLYGGGSKGAVLGSGGTTTTLADTQVTGSVYGAGEGERIDGASGVGTMAFLNDVQRIVGWVKGSASLELDAVDVGDSSHASSVFGGGNLGVVGDGTVSTSAPYYTSNGGGTTVYIRTATIAGSLFGGGAGDATASSYTPRMLGAVFGTSYVTLHQGAIGSDVFGGGDQSYNYAPLDGDTPQQATKVVINGSGSIYANSATGAIVAAGDAGTVEVDNADALPDGRAISLNGSVFGAGNIADETTVHADTSTVYGNTDVFIKGTTVTFANADKGGVYGDGNLSTAKGVRHITIIDLKNSAGGAGGANADARKTFFSLQRADRAVVHNSNVYLKGARDLTSVGDTTLYSVNRINELDLYRGSTVQFDTVVNGLGKLWSDTLSDRDFMASGGTHAVTAYGDNVSDAEKQSLRDFCESGGSWRDADGNEHVAVNSIVVNNGKWLDVKQAESGQSQNSYGTVTGLFALTSDNGESGGAFVFAQYVPADSKGTFVSLNKKDDQGAAGGQGGQGSAAATYLELYTRSCTDNDGNQCRVWYIEANAFSFTRTIKASTEGQSAPIQVLLPVKRTNTATLQLKESTTVQAADTLTGLKANHTADDTYTFTMKLGDQAASASASNSLLLYEGQAASGWAYDYAHYATQETDLIPVTFSLDFGNITESFQPQSGQVAFTLTSSDGRTYQFAIEVSIEPVYASAAKMTHYGKEYSSIAIEDATPITPTSAYTTQFVTTYSPNAYRDGITTTLTTVFDPAVHGPNVVGASSFPANTMITMVDITTENAPAYYYYNCAQACTSIKLTDFHSLADASAAYKEKTGSTVIAENLLFIIDYSKVSGGMTQTPTYLALNHTRNRTGQDILRWTRQIVDAGGNTITEENYNNLHDQYQIATGVSDASFLTASLAEAGTTLDPSHTENFMYDTYTMHLDMNKNTTCTSTVYDENEVALAVWVKTESFLDPLKRIVLPLGSKVVVTDPRGVALDDVSYRFVDSTALGASTGAGQGYFVVNLGKKPLDGRYTIQLQVQRYLENGTIFDIFNWNLNNNFELHASLHRAADGTCLSADDASILSASASFSAARARDDDAPLYELNLKANEKILEGDNGDGTVTGEASTTNKVDEDVEMVVLRRVAETSAAWTDIVKGGSGTIKKETPASKKIRFIIADNPGAGVYDYQIRVGNTVYYEDAVAVTGASGSSGGA